MVVHEYLDDFGQKLPLVRKLQRLRLQIVCEILQILDADHFVELITLDDTHDDFHEIVDLAL